VIDGKRTRQPSCSGSAAAEGLAMRLKNNPVLADKWTRHVGPVPLAPPLEAAQREHETK